MDRLFVYGTLRTGQERWSFLEPFVSGPGNPDQAAGRLFDSGLGFPAALFDDDRKSRSGTIFGDTFELSSESLHEALELLDEVESAVEGLYKRTQITTDSGKLVWAYQYGEGLALTPIPSGDWLVRE